MSHHRRVYVVAREIEVRRLMSQHVGGVGAEAWPFSSGAEFLRMIEHLEPGCVLLDMDMADLAGIDVLTEMRVRSIGWPVIAMCEREEMQLAVAAMKLGAIDFLRLPPAREVLALALAPAWKALDEAVEAGAARREAQARIARLTAREVDVSLALLGGGSNKKIAHEFGISVRTVEMHRAHIMAKLGVRSLAEAAVLATQAGLDLTRRMPPAPRSRVSGFAEAGFPGGNCREQVSTLARRLSS
jgi:two-component system, LuxR family, response regulator FixJ